MTLMAIISSGFTELHLPTHFTIFYFLFQQKSNKSALLQKYIESNEKKYFLKLTNQNLLHIKALQVFQPKIQLIFINSNKYKPALWRTKTCIS